MKCEFKNSWFRMILLSGIILSVWSCNRSKSSANGATNDVDVKVKKFDVSINVYQKNSYCGGARPSEEMLNEISAPKPMQNEMFYVREGVKNDVGNPILDSAKTNESGELKLRLPPGDYCLISSKKKDSSYSKTLIEKYGINTKDYSAIDTQCLNSWISEADFVFVIKDKSTISFDYLIHNQCWWKEIPCVDYKGPLPN